MYFKIYKKISSINKNYRLLRDSSIFEFFFNRLSNIFIPFFVIFKIKPNSISIFNFFLGLLSIIFITYLDNLRSGIAIFFLTMLIDNIDGGVARYTKKTFFGRFIDSLSDAIIFSLFYFSIAFYFFELNQDLMIFCLGIISSFFILIEILILDKFSALVRWCNLENKLNNLPYVRKTYFLRFFLIIRDLILLLTFLLIFFYNEVDYFYFIIILINSLWLITSFFNICLHIYFGKKFLDFNQK
jgi:phosphatidylserine synthase